MNRRVLALWTVGAAALIAPALSTPSLAASAGSSDPGTLPAKFDMVAAGRLNQAIQKLEAKYPKAAGGVYVDESTGQLVLRLVDDPDRETLKSNARAAALAEAAGVGFRTESADRSEEYLRAKAAQMQASTGWAGAYADDVRGVGVDLFKNVIVVRASGHVDEVQAAARAEAATGVVTKLSGDPVPTLSRRLDDDPYAGGLGLWLESTASYNSKDVWCTSGFKMTKNGITFVSVALHCGGYNTDYWNATTRVARVSAGYGGAGGIDGALLAPAAGRTFSDNEWWGDKATTTAYDVSGRYSQQLPVGAKVYISGGNGGLHWGYITGDVVPCVLGGVSCGMVQVDTSESGGAPIGGDSGGPVMIWNTSTSDPHDVRSVAMQNCSDPTFTTYAYITYMYRLEALSGATVTTS